MVQTAPRPVQTFEAVVDQYFEGFNQENYAAVATLFADDGVLLPPFETEIFGPPAIATYLAKEAAGMTAIPVERQGQGLDDNESQLITVKGRVKTPLFTVSVQWLFQINADHQIQRVELKLLASLQELLQFNRGSQ